MARTPWIVCSMLGMAQRRVAEQGVDRRQAGVAGPRAVVAVVSQMGEERTDHVDVKVLDVESERRLAGAGLGEASSSRKVSR